MRNTEHELGPNLDPLVRLSWQDMNPVVREHLLQLVLEGEMDMLPTLVENVGKNVLTDSSLQ